jgi:hypothetical protein
MIYTETQRIRELQDEAARLAYERAQKIYDERRQRVPLEQIAVNHGITRSRVLQILESLPRIQKKMGKSWYTENPEGDKQNGENTE